MGWRSEWIFDLGAASYDWFTANPTWRDSAGHLADHLPEQPAPRVADLGCGPGVSAIALARKRPDARIVCVDLAARMLKQARERVSQAGLDGCLHLVRADALHLPFASGSLEAVTGHSFLYLLPDRATALAEARRVLRPGGRIVLMEPNERPGSLPRVLAVSRHPRFLVAMVLWRAFSRLHGRFSVESLPATLENSGFVNAQAEEILAGLGVVGWADTPAPER